MTRFLIAALLSGVASVVAADHEHEHEEGGEEHAFAIGDFIVEHAWTRATTGSDAYVFMLLHNLSEEAVEVQGATAAVASAGSLVGFVLENGQEVAVPLPEVPVPAGREMDLEPGVMAVHLEGLTAELEQGHHLEMTLLTSVGALDLDAEIGAADARQHSHAGHSHLGEMEHDAHDHEGHDHAEEAHDDHDHDHE